jgi:hypothetical protein
VRNSASKLADGIDIRGEGGFVICPPSMHPSGGRYCWSVDSANAFAQAPQWLLDKIAEPKNSNGNAPAAEWRDVVTAEIPEGRRDDTITRVAGYLLRRRVDPIVALELLHALNLTRCKPPLADTDIHKIVNSIARRELRRREADNG